MTNIRSNINSNLGPSYIGVFTLKVSTKSFSLYVEDPLFVTLFMKVIRSLAILFKVHLKLCIRPKWNSSFNWEFSSTPNKQVRVNDHYDSGWHVLPWDHWSLQACLWAWIDPKCHWNFSNQTYQVMNYEVMRQGPVVSTSLGQSKSKWSLTW